MTDMKRLTTDDTESILLGLNLFFAKDNEVWIRGGGPEPDYPECTLTDWINRAAAVQEIELGADDAESLGDVMYDCLQYGVDATEGILALLHAAAVQAAEMRGRLAAIEDILSDDYDLDRLRELVTAAREGRCGISPVKLHQHIYRVFDGKILEEIVCKAMWEPFTPKRWKVWVMGSGLPYYWDNCIGKTVFLTREAADAALKGEHDAVH